MMIAAVYAFVFTFVLAVSPAWAGQRWYLLVPDPEASNEEWKRFLESDSFVAKAVASPGLIGKMLGTDKPLTKWTQFGVYDSVNDCARQRAALMNDLSGEPLLKELTYESRCIATDDPRLRVTVDPSGAEGK
jgi:hypothetical protein